MYQSLEPHGHSCETAFILTSVLTTLQNTLLLLCFILLWCVMELKVHFTRIPGKDGGSRDITLPVIEVIISSIVTVYEVENQLP
uniref:Uncharacterized protein n=1 Tax=Arion vulgaris TaxID=1028688 RepID=A0A0B6ZPZ6_9EUPU